MRTIAVTTILLNSLWLAACASKPPTTSNVASSTTAATFTVQGMASDPAYGYSQEQPICVGDSKDADAGGEYEYLRQLAGPNGEKLSYRRVGHCCPFKTPRGFDNTGLLDRYEVTWSGAGKPVVLYLNMYDPAPDQRAIPVPQGFTLKQR